MALGNGLNLCNKHKIFSKLSTYPNATSRIPVKKKKDLPASLVVSNGSFTPIGRHWNSVFCTVLNKECFGCYLVSPRVRVFMKTAKQIFSFIRARPSREYTAESTHNAARRRGRSFTKPWKNRTRPRAFVHEKISLIKYLVNKTSLLRQWTSLSTNDFFTFQIYSQTKKGST